MSGLCLAFVVFWWWKKKRDSIANSQDWYLKNPEKIKKSSQLYLKTFEKHMSTLLVPYPSELIDFCNYTAGEWQYHGQQCREYRVHICGPGENSSGKHRECYRSCLGSALRLHSGILWVYIPQIFLSNVFFLLILSNIFFNCNFDIIYFL